MAVISTVPCHNVAAVPFAFASASATSRCRLGGLVQPTPTSCLQVACETATKTDMVMIFGEITTSAKVDYEKVVRDTCRTIGFTSNDVGLDADTCKVG